MSPVKNTSNSRSADMVLQIMKNRQWLIDGNPYGRAVSVNDFKRIETALPDLKDNDVRVQVNYLEFTPSLKGQMENRVHYAEKIEHGGVMRGRGIGTVIASNSETLSIGDKVLGYLGWQDIATVQADTLKPVADDKYLTKHMGPLGSSGMAAYFGMTDVGKIKPGDKVLVSGAAGAVGSMAGQIAKLLGCEVYGVAGGAEKCSWLTQEAGLAGSIDYKAENMNDRFQEIAPDGFNVVYDNVGGDFLEAALDNIAFKARIVICGGISRYDAASPPPGPSTYFNIVMKSASMIGFISVNYKDQFEEAAIKMKSLLDTGEFAYREDIQSGFENIPSTFLRIFNGQNKGKQLIQLAS